MVSPVRPAGRTQQAIDSFTRALTHHQYASLVLASLGYLAITLYRAGRRLFWFDEIFTFYIARLPDLGSIWAACVHGVDFNPPMLYLLTRWSEDAFGANEFGARIPQVVGFWVFCLCLYRFVSVRTGALAGFIAFVFPITTAGYWYATDARSHGLVLGFFGLAFISWQAAMDRSSRRWLPLTGLAASLTGAALCHCYAFLLFIPFGLGELVRTFVRKRFDAAVWCALLVPAIVSVITVLPLLRAVRGKLPAGIIGNPWQHIGSGWDLSVHRGLAVALVVLISAWIVTSPPGSRPTADTRIFAGHELGFLIGTLCTPLFAFFSAVATDAPLYGRYSLAAITGAACLVAAACSQSRLIGLLLLFACLAIITKQFAWFGFLSVAGEPSTCTAVGTRSPAANFSFEFLEASAGGDEPIVLLDPMEFAPMFHYARGPLRSRFVYLIPDVNGEGYVRLQQCCAAPGRIASRDAFFATHRSFFMYGAETLPRKFFPPPPAEITLKGCVGARCLFHVA